MELKHNNKYWQLSDKVGFNRTFMELKQVFKALREIAKDVLIGPSWN